MKKVLICLDTNARSARVAYEGIQFVKSFNSEVSLIHVIDTNQYVNGESPTTEVVERKKRTARRFLEKILNLCSCAAILYIEEGDPIEKILAKAKSLEADIVILGAKSKSKPKKDISRTVMKELMKLPKIAVVVL